MLLYAKSLQNPREPVIHAPAVWIQQDRIVYAGGRNTLPREALNDADIFDLADAALFPGLVNAHSHLELSFLHELEFSGGFTSWIRQVLAKKNQSDPQMQKQGLSKGILLAILGGTTCVGDHISFNADLENLLHSPLRGHLFIEVLGVVPEVAQEVLAAAENLTQIYQDKFPRWSISPTPHSVHALVPSVLEKCFASPHDLFSMHLSESQDEELYFEKATGPLFDLIAERGTELKHHFVSAIQELESRGFIDNRVLAIHGNYLTPPELAICGQRGVSIVYCPLSHEYFGHRKFPMQAALDADVNVALGTDSLASAPSLSMLEVLRKTHAAFPDRTPAQILEMATLNGAKALKLENEIGSITAGKKADLIGVRQGDHAQPLEALLAADHVEFSMIDGVILMR